jgi:hypothetical protein
MSKDHMPETERRPFPPATLREAYDLYELEGYEATTTVKMLLKNYLEHYPHGIRILELMVDDFIFEYHGRAIDWHKYR